MKKIITLVLMLILFTLAIIISFSLKPKKIFFPRENEIRIIDEDKLNAEINNLASELNNSSEDIKIAVELGIRYFIKGPQYYDQAINLLYRAWKSGSTDIRIFYYLGCMYEFLKLYHMAIDEYKKFLNNVPDDMEVLIRLGNLYYKVGNLNESIKIFDSVLQKDRNNIIALSNLGFIYFSQNQLDKSQELFNQVLSISKKKNIIEPRSINYYLGKIFYNNRNYETAKTYLLKEQQLYPDNIENSLLLVKTYMAVEEYEEAYNLAGQLLEITPENRELKLLLKNLKSKVKS